MHNRFFSPVSFHYTCLSYMYMYWRSDLLHILMILSHLCVPAYPFFALLSFHCTWQSYMYLKPTAHTPSLTWSCRTYTQSFFFSLVSFHCTWHSYTLLSYDLVTLTHSVFPCLMKVVWIRDFICLNPIYISHSVSLFVCAHYLARCTHFLFSSYWTQAVATMLIFHEENKSFFTL